MLVKLRKRRGEYPTGAIADLPQEEAEGLIAFGLADHVQDVDAEGPTRHVERAKVSKAMRTATLPTETVTVAEIVEPEA
jgi:hypothetical protein